jgi:hypothetical protein
MDMSFVEVTQNVIKYRGVVNQLLQDIVGFASPCRRMVHFMPVIASCKGFKLRVDHTLYGSPAGKGIGEAAFSAGRRKKIIRLLVISGTRRATIAASAPAPGMRYQCSGMRGFPEHILCGRNHLQAAVCKNNRFIRLVGGIFVRDL